MVTSHCCQLLLWQELDLRPGNFHVLWVQQKKKKKQLVFAIKIFPRWSSRFGIAETNLRKHEVAGSISGLAHWCCCELWCRSRMRLGSGDV